MTSPARLERADDTVLAPSTSYQTTTELPVVLVDPAALRLEQATLRRDVLLWQRWVRYLAIGTMVLLSLVFGSAPQAAYLPITLIAVGYYATVLGTAMIVRRVPATSVSSLFPALLLATDIAALAGFCYLTSPPQELHRILLLGLLSVQLGVF
jgi:hypothetical protein